VLALILLAGDAMPPAAPWVKPVAPPPTQSPDFQLCTNNQADVKLRGEACDRLIVAGRLTGNALALAYFGRGYMRASSNQIDGAISDYSEALRADASFFAGYRNRGLLLLEKTNDMAAAERDFTKAIEVAPPNAAAIGFAGRAEARRKQGRLAEAQADIARALELEKDNRYAQMVRDGIQADLKRAGGPVPARPEPPPQDADAALCNNMSADRKQRGEACDRLIASGRLSGSQLADAYFGRGLMHSQANQTDAAIADYSEAVRLNPGLLGGYYNRGTMYFNKSDLAAAERDFTKAIELAPGNSYAAAFAARAEARRRLRRFPEAQADIGRALDLDKDDKYAERVRDSIQADLRRPAEDEPTTQRKRAKASLDQRDYDAAIGGLTQLIRAGSREFSDYYHRGVAYQAKRQPDLAFADFTQAIGLSGHDWQPHFRRAQILMDRGQPDDALRDLDEAVRAHAGKDADIFLLRGQVHEKKQAYARAIEDFDKLVELAPNFANGYLLRGRALAAEERAQMDACRNRPPGSGDRIVGGPCTRPFNFSAALTDLRMAISKKPDLADAHEEIGKIMVTLNRPDEAVQAFSNAIRHEPNAGAHYNSRGFAYNMLNRREAALADFDQAVRLSPNIKEAWFNRGASREREGQRQQAIEDYRRALTIDRQYLRASEALKRLGAQP
jgi:tetratricopeptide (TPR) repeat protein